MLAPAMLAGQTPATGAVTGRVTARTDTTAGVPAAGAVISVAGRPGSTTARSDGRFLISRVPAGDVTLRVRLLGFGTVGRAIRVLPGDTVRLDVTLQRDVQQLLPVHTTAQAADVEIF